MTERISVKSASLHLAALRFIHQHIQAYGYAPSVRDVTEALQYSSSSSGQAVFNGMRRRGWIATAPGRARAIVITPEGHEALRNA